MGDTTIAWTDKTWNPMTGCTKVSQGCKNCYAERIFHRPYPGRSFTDVRCHPERLDQPLRWRKSCRIFVNSMSDLFHEDVPSAFIGKVFGIMAVCPWHSFQILTKRQERMRDLLVTSIVGPLKGEAEQSAYEILDARRPKSLPSLRAGDWPGLHWPLPNVWLGVSVEDQAIADERIPLLLQTPATVRFVSYEPALGPVDFRAWLPWKTRAYEGNPSIQWIIAGGESGPKARTFDIEWARNSIDQCRAANIPCFVKQLGARPCAADPSSRLNKPFRYKQKYADDETGQAWVQLSDRAGADPSEWPSDLRVREFPK